MLKRIPKSDISVRPFKAYKEWTFDQSSNEISLLEANISSSDLSGLYPKNSIYGQLKAQFYNGHEDNPFLRFGSKSNLYETSSAGKERYLGNDAKIISIPQIYVGEGIKKGSFSLTDNVTKFIDDSYGNIFSSAGDKVIFTLLDLETGAATFLDIASNSYNVTITTFNVESDLITITYLGDTYTAHVVSFNINNGEMVADNIRFLSGAAGTDRIGNIFYNQGLVVLTKNINDLLTSNWHVDFKSTQTIYEHEYLLIVNEDEFNVSQNPSAVVEVGKETAFMTGSDDKVYKVTTNPGVKYIRKKSILNDGSIMDYSIGSSYNTAISGGFDQYEYSSSLDSTGSYLAPFITTIGLYDDNCDLVAVAKLPQPIKSYPDLPVNFIVRFDT